MVFPFEINTYSVEETENVGFQLGKYIFENGISSLFIAMYGDLGAGKTAFVRGLASCLAPSAYVSSPTYTVVNEYRGPKARLCHFDMYRIDSEDDLYSIGFYDYCDCIIAAEWCEKIPYALPDCFVKVEIIKRDSERLIRITEESNADSRV